MIGKSPKAAPSVADSSAVSTGMPHTATAITIETASAISPATCARSLRPPSRMNSVASGIIATRALANSEPPTGIQHLLVHRGLSSLTSAGELPMSAPP